MYESCRHLTKPEIEVSLKGREHRFTAPMAYPQEPWEPVRSVPFCRVPGPVRGR